MVGSATETPWKQGVYDNWGINLTVVAVTVVAVAACVMIHYEVLSWLSRRLGQLDHVGGRRRRRVLYGIFGVLSVHVVEIWIFGLVYYLMQVGSPAFGHIQGIAAASLIDHVYFSAVTFTTVGFGDVIPAGPIRFLAGTEALAGFVLITWSASFTYLEMNRFWRRD
ncbi:MAG: ion channel [Rhodanobacter sp.]